MDVKSWTIKKAERRRTAAFELWCWKDSWASLGLQGDQASRSWNKSVLNIHWKDWCWSWSYSTLATWCKKLTCWKDPWWETLKAGEGATEDEMVVWHHQLNGHEFEHLQELMMDGEAWCAAAMGSQRVGNNWLTNWTVSFFSCFVCYYFLPFWGLPFYLVYSFLCCAKAFKFN